MGTLGDTGARAGPRSKLSTELSFYDEKEADSDILTPPQEKQGWRSPMASYEAKRQSASRSGALTPPHLIRDNSVPDSGFIEMLKRPSTTSGIDSSNKNTKVFLRRPSRPE